VLYQPPSAETIQLWFGADFLGRSVLVKTLHGACISMTTAAVALLVSVPLGLLLGGIAGYFGGWVDDVVVWFYSVISSIPNIMALLAIALVFGRGMIAVCMALGLTGWVGLARIVRGEVIKHKTHEYVLAAESIGAGHLSRIFRHILPNIAPLVVVNMSVQFAAAVKAEVVLSFLGLGAQNRPSWGVMIDDARMEMWRGVWWQFAAAGAGIFLLVLAINILSDALVDVCDPKLK
jgi:peptide/nickel transport system permease protein